MSLGSPEIRESGESHPLAQSLKQRCLVLVDKPMETEGLPDLAIVHAIGEGDEDPHLSGENCRQFMEWATDLLTLSDEKRQFTYADPVLLTDDVSENFLVIDFLEKIHIEKLALAHESAYALKKRVGLAFAKLQPPQVSDDVYEALYPRVQLPPQGTEVRMILDRVTLTKNLELTGFEDPNADYVLYTGGDYPVPYAYSKMEVFAGGDSGVRIIRPYQLVYGLQTGALIRATSEQKEERFSDIDRCINNFGDLGGAVGRPSYSRDIFYFKSIK